MVKGMTEKIRIFEGTAQEVEAQANELWKFKRIKKLGELQALSNSKVGLLIFYEE
jgi:hypothetical protein